MVYTLLQYAAGYSIDVKSRFGTQVFRVSFNFKIFGFTQPAFSHKCRNGFGKGRVVFVRAYVTLASKYTLVLALREYKTA